MYKLNGHSLTKGAWFLPESQPMTLAERESSCQVQVDPAEAPEIGFDDWILDDSWPEGPYVWRVKNITDTPTADTLTLELEHAIRTLEGRKIFGQVTPETIAGSGATECTAKQAVQYLLSLQGDWTLGDFAYNSSGPYEFSSGQSVFDAIGEVCEGLDLCQWEYDFTVYPFKLHIRQRSSEVGSEMRCGRNLSVIRRSVSRSGMYTRIYPVGQNDLHLSTEYLSKNEALYGRIDKIETDQTKTTEDSLRAWAQGRLDRHCEPTVSITVTGLELSRETGEALDRIRLNRLCRVPLPRKNLTITERVVRLQWRDRRKDPESVTVTLANNTTDASTIIRANRVSTEKSEAAQSRMNAVFETHVESLHYEMFAECGHLHSLLDMTAESLRIHFDNLNESTRSEFRMTAESLRISFDNEIESARSEFEMTAQSIRLSVSGVADSDGNVTAASIVLAINQSTGQSEAKIDADKVYIGNTKSTTIIAGKCSLSDVTANYIDSKIAELALLHGISAYFSGSIRVASGLYLGSDSTDVSKNLAKAVISVSVANNTLTLTQADGTETTFSKATSLSGAWSGATFTVTASPQGNTQATTITLDGGTGGVSSPDYTANSFIGHKAYVNVKGSQTSGTVTVKKILVDATSEYNTGSSDGYSSAKMSGSWNGNVLSITKNTTGSNSLSYTVVAAASISYDSSTHKYTATANASGGGVVRDTKTSTGGTEAYDAGYNAGWNACRNKMINDQYQSTFFTGREQLIMDYDGNNLWVIYPYQQTTITRYYVPDAR